VPSTSIRASARALADEEPRPLTVPFAAAFGGLVTAEVAYFGLLLWLPDPALDWFLVVPLVLAVASVTGSVQLLRRRTRSWLLLAIAAAVVQVGLLATAALLAAFSAWGEMWSAVLLMTGPVGCLVLTLRRSVREWTDRGRTRRSGGRRRGTANGRIQG
jgi:O-antigen/teichoic acid export membrane protein